MIAVASRRALLAVLVGIVVLVSACDRGGGPSGRVVLDGTPRRPDAEGVVERITRERITLDGGRSFEVSSELQSFSTSTLETVPVLGREGEYVHIGLEGRTMVWFATVGSVIPGDPPVAYYIGTLEEIKGGRAYFRDGTVLRVAIDADVAIQRGFGQVEIDPSAHVVRAIRAP